MENSKLDAQAKLGKQHDIIKTHPYRMDFDPKWRSDYIECLFGLSRIWSDYIWLGDHGTDENKRLMRQWGRWVHNYNQELLLYRGRKDIPFRRFYYYEQMLQLTHEFIKTGELPVYYEIAYLWNDEPRSCRGVEKYELVTKESCGIDSKFLPCYLPMDYSMRIDDEAIREYIFTDFHYNRKTEEEKTEIYKNWLVDVKPVLEWLNSKHDETKLKHAVWQSAQLAG